MTAAGSAGPTRPGAYSALRERSPIAAEMLPDVVHDSPAAILLVDLDSGQVVFANQLAAQLAPGTGLPISVDDWSRAAGLEDAGGDDLAGDHGDPGRPGRGQPLSRVARGEPVLGEQVSAARSGTGIARREPLWVIGLPLSGAPGELGRQAVVVFLPARRSSAVASAQESALRDRAMLATRIAITISDPAQPDNPLIWVNPAFLEVTGYQREEVLGRNCRFLQGEDTDRSVVAEIRASIQRREPVTATLLNHRADGTPFWNQVTISPVFDPEGRVTHFVGVQADVTERVETDAARDRALADAQRSRDRLALLAAFSARLTGSLDPDEIVRIVGESLVPRLGAWSLTVVPDERGGFDAVRLHRPAVDDSGRPRVVDAVAEGLPEPGGEHPVARMLRGELRAGLVADTDVLTADWPKGPSGEQFAELVGGGSLVLAPVTARGAVLGVVGIGTAPGDPPFGDDDVAVIEDLAARAGLALDNARLFAGEHQAAETLQRALLPELPDIDGLDLSAEYLPATARNAVGGDWYDVLRLRDELGVGIAIGDVMGHDLAAAAAMGQLRSVLRSYAYPGARPPAVLHQLDQLVQSLHMGSLATCVYGRLVRGPDGAGTFTWASGGHPPPLLVLPDGRVQVLRTSASRIVGVPYDVTDDVDPLGSIRDEGRVGVPVGATLLLYTDGLVETHDRDIDSGIAQLVDFVRALPRGLSAGELVGRLTAQRSVAERDDDVAVLAVRLL